MKIGILSLAHHHAEAYTQILHTIPGIEIMGISDDDPERGLHFAEKYEVDFYTSFEGLLSKKPDGVIVCAENSKHRLLVEMAASYGANVLCEKPLATTLPDANAIVAACERAGVLLMTAYPMRFSAPLMQLKARLDAGQIGKVYCFNATNQGELPLKYRQWFVDEALAGGGAIMDHTVHLVDVMRWYLENEVTEVYAQCNHIFHKNEVKVETGGLEMITFRDGTFATIDSSWSKPDYWPSWGGLTLEIVTERGAVLIDAFKQRLTVYQQTQGRPIWAYWGSDSNQAMIEEFVAAIRENRQARVTGIDGLRSVEVALAAYESVKIGRPVQLS